MLQKLSRMILFRHIMLPYLANTCPAR